MIANSVLEGNEALNGGALYPRWSGAQTTIVGSVLRNNRATDTNDGWGGAILAWDGAPVTIDGSDIEGNSAREGGGIYNFANSILTLQGNTRLRNNVARFGGGMHNDGIATLTNVTLSGNSSGSSGGALYNDLGTALLANVTLNGNSAGGEGGGLVNYSTVTLINVTVSGNSASTSGGGLFNGGKASLTNVTLSGNSASSNGGGIYHSSFAIADTLTLKNTIVANSPLGGNCRASPFSVTNITSAGYNISSDNTCALSGTGDRNGVNPLLTALGNYGGPTQVHMLKPGSPAIDGVLGSDAPTTDQRGVARPQGGGYDIGAVERRSSDSSLAPREYLPVGFK